MGPGLCLQCKYRFDRWLAAAPVNIKLTGWSPLRCNRLSSSRYGQSSVSTPPFRKAQTIYKCTQQLAQVFTFAWIYGQCATCPQRALLHEASIASRWLPLPLPRVPTRISLVSLCLAVPQSSRLLADPRPSVVFRGPPATSGLARVSHVRPAKFTASLCTVLPSAPVGPAAAGRRCKLCAASQTHTRLAMISRVHRSVQPLACTCYCPSSLT